MFFINTDTLKTYHILFIHLLEGRARTLCHGTCVEVKGQLEKSVLAFHHVSLRDQTQVTKLGGQHLYQLSLLADPHLAFFVDCNDHLQGPAYKDHHRSDYLSPSSVLCYNWPHSIPVTEDYLVLKGNPLSQNELCWSNSCVCPLECGAPSIFLDGRWKR